MNYYIVIPAHNEEQFIGKTLASIVNQSLLPKRLVVVDDNSKDKTAAIIDEFAATYSFIQRVDAVSSSEHMPGSKVIQAFNKGLNHLDEHYDFIVKLDADLILPMNYFEQIAQIFAEQPRVGIAGGFAYEKDESEQWVLNHPMNKNHVRGAFKAYSKACFLAIGKLKVAMGWDTVDELLAIYHGYEIRTNERLKVKHLRPTGNSYNAKAKFLQGEAMYKMRYGLFITIISSVKMAWKKRNFRTVVDNVRGFFLAKQQQLEPIVTMEEGRFIRAYRLRGMLNKLNPFTKH